MSMNPRRHSYLAGGEGGLGDVVAWSFTNNNPGDFNSRFWTGPGGYQNYGPGGPPGTGAYNPAYNPGSAFDTGGIGLLGVSGQAETPYERNQRMARAAAAGTNPVTGLAPWNPKGGIQRLTFPAGNIAQPLGTQAPGVTSQALANLAKLLRLEGQADPRIMQRQIVGAERGTEAQTRAVRTNLASRGLAGGGFSDTLLAAVGQGGQERVADIRARDAEQAETRKRQDIQAIMPFLSVILGLGELGETRRRTKKSSSGGGGLAALGQLAGLAQGINWGGGGTTGSTSSAGYGGSGYGTSWM